MVRHRKAEALFHYAIIISIVAVTLATMHTYLRRSIQAKVKDLTDHIISDRQLASLNDPATEKLLKNTDSVYSLQRVESPGGVSNLSTVSTYTVQLEHEVENLDQIDYGQGVPNAGNPNATYLEDGSGLVAGEQPADHYDDDGRKSGGGF